MLKNNLAEKHENYDMADDVKASTFMTETEVQATVASNVNDNREGVFPLPPKGGAATKAVEENTGSSLSNLTLHQLTAFTNTQIFEK